MLSMFVATWRFRQPVTRPRLICLTEAAGPGRRARTGLAQVAGGPTLPRLTISKASDWQRW